MEEKNQNSDYFKVPKAIVEIPKIEAKWKTAPEYQITNKIPIESARNILIMTSWRFGSTFLGDLLNHYPGVFYTFEPLHYLSRKVRITIQYPLTNVLVFFISQSEMLKSFFSPFLCKNCVDIMELSKGWYCFFWCYFFVKIFIGLFDRQSQFSQQQKLGCDCLNGIL